MMCLLRRGYEAVASVGVCRGCCRVDMKLLLRLRGVCRGRFCWDMAWLLLWGDECCPCGDMARLLLLGICSYCFCWGMK